MIYNLICARKTCQRWIPFCRATQPNGPGRCKWCGCGMWIVASMETVRS